MIEIPLRNGSANAHQRFEMTLAGSRLLFEIDYLTYIQPQGWSMNIIRDGSMIVSGAILVSGCDVIELFDAGIGKMVMVGDCPTLDNLGVSNHLVWMQ